ncbi:MAG: PIN domain-containing protein [Spirochaetales bacterium]|nr:PIN domain-containing protein [Spirochaetales bacterium]
MNSVDTNILLYATNRDCPEHGAARALVDRALSEPQRWIVADQVYFELYRLLRNPGVLARPLPASDATRVVEYYRAQSGWGRCAWDIELFERIRAHLLRDTGGRIVFDLVLAATLHDAGVERFYTRNAKDFDGLGWFDVENPIDGAPAAP